jgi:NAD(P)-dependent dehydrogenase (short-subunit alcohol dehydrogenase family)
VSAGDDQQSSAIEKIGEERRHVPELAGKVALVTGGGAGIGEAIARRFAEEGAKVVVAERDTRTGQEVAVAIGGLFVPVDVAVRDQVENAVAQAVSAYGSIDIVVNNAWGGGSMGRVENKTDQQLSHGIAIAYYGPFWAMRAALPHMRDRGWGRVINVCSLNGVNAHMGTLEYNAAKEALRALTRTAAREWAPYGVIVNAICPAAKSAAFLRALGSNPDIVAFADSMNPMGRVGDPYLDISPVALFLAGEGCRYLTGNTLFVDGGSHINGVAWTPDLDAAT